MSRPTRLLLRFLAIVVLGVTAMALIGSALLPEIGKLPEAASFQPLSKLALPSLPEASQIITVSGQPYGTLAGSENRDVVSLDQISPELQKTVLAVEDADFYEHDGVSAKSILRAFRANSDAGTISQGGSTITQQLVKISLVGDERNITRKMKEASLAVQLEQQLCEGVAKKVCKDQILEQYLNTVYLGRGAYGMQAGAQTYFNKPASEINYAEAAVLASLIRNPNGYDPIRFPKVAKERRLVVLKRMQEQGLVNEQEAAMIAASPLPTEAFGRPVATTTESLSYVERKVRDELLNATWLAPTQELRRYLIFNGGLKITTTIDPAMQQAAEAAAASNPLKAANPETSVALAAVEPGTGAVRAVVGEATVPDKGLVETAAPTGGRSSGSSFKVFTLVAALEAGYSINSTVSGAYAPESMKKLWGIKESGPYPDDCPSHGMVDLGRALAQSNNCAFMRLQGAVGFDAVKDTAVKLGLTESSLDPNHIEPACFTIGCDALVKPLDMALAYGTIANDGRRNDAHFVAKVEDRTGKVLFEAAPRDEQVVPVDVARQAIIGMEKVVTNGTYSAGSLPQRRPAAGKTGTTEVEGGKNTDVWFVGFTPQLSTAVWIGNPAANTNMKGGRVQGGATAARVWHAFMSDVLDGAPVIPFAEPDRVPKAKSVPDPWKSSSKYGSGSSSSSSSKSSGSTRSKSSGTTKSTTPSSGTKSTTPPAGGGTGGGGTGGNGGGTGGNGGGQGGGNGGGDGGGDDGGG
ncbi:transglycosylase domain-containing protein [Dermatobacter hominis]|uniref:transglycosylase domain-containing protein n=1 Tax=Dermatobacter hominis TaxID=2884263 RepID=UPI001D10A072|nr:transglycosylase domain-containing protein [Dermatobacter hominis]UDY35907.1 penicillin-binding protein [Dermatobacter hominis]